jgi:hypothetical protein
LRRKVHLEGSSLPLVGLVGEGFGSLDGSGSGCAGSNAASTQ